MAKTYRMYTVSIKQVSMNRCVRNRIKKMRGEQKTKAAKKSNVFQNFIFFASDKKTSLLILFTCDFFYWYNVSFFPVNFLCSTQNNKKNMTLIHSTKRTKKVHHTSTTIERERELKKMEKILFALSHDCIWNPLGKWINFRMTVCTISVAWKKSEATGWKTQWE